jgi:hypothetical protein
MMVSNDFCGEMLCNVSVEYEPVIKRILAQRQLGNNITFTWTAVHYLAV